jgi:hypothetical protein
MNRPAARDYDNKHSERRAFVIGGGASIKNIQMGGFKFSDLTGEVTFGVNKAYKLLIPTYVVFGDAYFWKNWKSELIRISCLKIAPENILRGQRLNNFIIVRRSTNPRDIVPSNMSVISFVNNSGVAALRIAYAMGCNPIYLVGIDAGPSESGETHFHKDYEKDKNRVTSPQRYKQFHKSFVDTIKKMEDLGRDIYSCSEGSSLNSVMPFVRISEVIQGRHVTGKSRSEKRNEDVA